jgi:hypothetical protein
MKKNLIGLLFSGRGKLKKLLLTMKLTSILVLFFTLQISASVYSQSTKFNYDFRGKRSAKFLTSLKAIHIFASSLMMILNTSMRL